MATSMEASVDGLPEDVANLLEKYPELTYSSEKNLITCSLTGHYMHCNSAVILSYVSGKKFKKLQEKNAFSYKEYEPHIVPSVKKGQRHMLFCKLTLRHFSKTPKNVQLHVSGRRYKRALQRWEECKKTGEKFHPFPKKNKVNEEEEKLEDEKLFFDVADESSASESDADSMTDLYPPEDFMTMSEEDHVNMTLDDMPSSETVTSSKRKSQKSKMEKFAGPSKKKKKKH